MRKRKKRKEKNSTSINEKEKKEDCFSIRACDLVVRRKKRKSFVWSIKTLPSFISGFLSLNKASRKHFYSINQTIVFNYLLYISSMDNRQTSSLSNQPNSNEEVSTTFYQSNKHFNSYDIPLNPGGKSAAILALQ
jgi:hypothetical protein